jgi:hypothetical protein
MGLKTPPSTLYWADATLLPPVSVTTEDRLTAVFTATGLGVAVVPEAVGAVKSNLMVTETELDSPALSIAEHVRIVPVVDDEMVVEVQPVLLAIPEIESATVQVTVTGLLFQPAGFGAGVTLGTIDGGARSTFTVMEAVLVRPAPFTAEHVKARPGVDNDT